MARRAFDLMMEGLDDAVAYANGDASRARVAASPDVRAIREKAGMSQDEFARALHISAATLRDWEQRRRRPVGPARTLLAMVDADTEGSLRILAQVRV